MSTERRQLELLTQYFLELKHVTSQLKETRERLTKLDEQHTNTCSDYVQAREHIHTLEQQLHAARQEAAKYEDAWRDEICYASELTMELAWWYETTGTDSIRIARLRDLSFQAARRELRDTIRSTSEWCDDKITTTTTTTTTTTMKNEEK